MKLIVERVLFADYAGLRLMAIKRKHLIWAGGVMLGIVIFGFLLQVVVYRDWAFVCENTGSHKGYREWVWGSQTGAWYRESSVEEFMQQKFPNELQHRWTSYAGTGYDLFGMKVLHGHGRPGIVKHLTTQWLNECFKPLSDAEKKAFYDLLVSNDQKAIENRIEYSCKE